MSYKRLKLKLRVFLAGHIVAMVTYCATKLTATYSPMIGQFVDTMILASTDKDVVIMIHQTVSFGKYCKLFPSTLRSQLYFRVCVGGEISQPYKTLRLVFQLSCIFFENS